MYRPAAFGLGPNLNIGLGLKSLDLNIGFGLNLNILDFNSTWISCNLDSSQTHTSTVHLWFYKHKWTYTLTHICCNIIDKCQMAEKKLVRLQMIVINYSSISMIIMNSSLEWKLESTFVINVVAWLDSQTVHLFFVSRPALYTSSRIWNSLVTLFCPFQHLPCLACP
jgi:hypothetical protein